MIRGLFVFCLMSSLAQAQVLSWSEFSAASIARSPEVRVAQTLVRDLAAFCAQWVPPAEAGSAPGERVATSAHPPTSVSTLSPTPTLAAA